MPLGGKILQRISGLLIVRGSRYLGDDMAAAPLPAVLRHLGAVTEDHPLDRKLLVCSSMGEGRELLRALARHAGSWVGWEITTPRRFAMERMAPALAAEGRTLADPYAEEAAVDTALDEALTDPALAGLRELAETPGFRQAVVNAVTALRLAAIDAARLPRDHAGVTRLLAAVLEGYRRELESRGLVDTATVLARALDTLEDADAPDPERVYLVPGLSRRGTTGRLVDALLARGAVALRSDPVALDAPPVVWEPDPQPAPLSRLTEGAPVGDGVELELFAASGPAEEVREVLRRVMAAELDWDQVEIIAPDPVVYGGALHVVAERLGISASYAVGLPVERTRPGRATTAYFRWIEGGYPADVIRRLLESGDLAAPGDVSPLRLAHRLRSLRIGWGHDRYLAAIERRREALHHARPRRHETEAEAGERIDRERAELDALEVILAPILEATPVLRRDDPAPVSPAALAAGLGAFLDRVAAADEPSAAARDRLSGIAERVAATLDRPTEPAAALALLRRHLEIRVPAPQREGAAPWVSDGGHIHLSDIEHGGYSGRAATFVVGLDADRFPGAGLQDPLLLDSQRRALDTDALPTSGERIAARRFGLAACLARLRGRVTLSYSAWEPTEARGVAPASVMLDAFRAATGRRDASFEDLAEGLGEAASPIARTGAIDDADLWFHALDHDGILAAGTDVVRAGFPNLDAGLRAAAALASDVAGPHHGLIRPRPGLDPRTGKTVLSASGLEDLGACGLRYLHEYVLGLRPPDDPELDPDVWLDALDRGRLLHTVFEKTLAEAREAQLAAGEPAFTALALEVLDREARFIAREVPPPGEVVRRREMNDLRADVRSFAHMMEGRDDRWRALELKFGLRGDPPAPLVLKGGELRLRGAIDRVDETPDGLVVVDYKTGSPSHYERRHGTFHGGRRLQNLVYSAVAEWALDAEVARMEYHFPTRRGRNEVIAYRRDELRRGRGLVDRLMDAVAAGRLLPTEEAADCGFCDYKPICRHRTDGWTRSWETPRADWAAAHFATLPEYRERRETRVWEETFLEEPHGETS
jgi:RecB family exonuclease